MKRVASRAIEPGHEAEPPASAAREEARFSRLLRAAQTGDRAARDQLVAANLDLVRSVAWRYRDLGLPLDDLVQEGSIGLLDAIDNYDRRRGAPFETYARFRVRRAIRNALTEKARLIRLPKQIVERRRAIERAEARLAAATAGGTPTPAQIAAETGLSVASVYEARAAGMTMVSLDEPILPDGSPLEDLVADSRAADPERNAIEREETDLLAAALAKLPERQRRVVRSRWGIGVAPVPNHLLATKLALSQRRTQTIGRDALYELRETLDPVQAV